VTTTSPLRIGPHRLDAPVILAPMAGVTDHAFRALCREFAPGLLYVSEMVTARALVERNEKTLTMMPRPEEPAPRSVQLYGTAPRTMGEAVRRLIDEHGVQHVDLNFGCPVPKVTRKGGGAALPVRRRLFGDIVAAAVRAAALDGVPLTVKFRMGVDDELLTFLEAGRIAEDVGAAAVALHARTAEQRYSGSARWPAIGELKAAVTTVPVLGNGDIWEAGDAVRMMAETGCDGVVIGRGCLGRPWLFADLIDSFAGRPVPPARRLGAVVPVLRRHADLLVETAGEVNGMRSMRRHSSWYLQGYPVGSEVRRRLGLVETRAELDEHVNGLDPTLVQEPGTEALPRGVTDGPRPVALPEGWLELRDDPTPPLGADLLVSGG
jgi:nifR3 family TIM-barrel protein